MTSHTRFALLNRSAVAIVLLTAATAMTMTMTMMIGCSAYKETGSYRGTESTLVQRTKEAIAEFKETDPTLARFFNNAYGYVVFPKVTKGAVGIGGAGGHGVVFEKGKAIGYSQLRQVTIGLQLGGQAYSEVIFLEKPIDLDRFARNEMHFSAQASAVAAADGAAANADYAEGVAVFTTGQSGLMFEASIGGQRFTYEPW